MLLLILNKVSFPQEAWDSQESPFHKDERTDSDTHNACCMIRWYKEYNYNEPQGVQFSLHANPSLSLGGPDLGTIKTDSIL